MKTLIFSDLHMPSQSVLDRIETIIADEDTDRVVFLGDYFDQFYEQPGDAERTAKWLLKSLAEPQRTHLIGNHDASYLWPVESTFCNGFSWEKETVIRETLGPNAKDKFSFHTWIDSWLLTHAGLSANWLTVPPNQLPKWLEGEGEAARKAFDQGELHWFVEAGRRRGGPHRAGGILWCDHKELIPVANIRQIYGHTPAPVVRGIGSDHVCLDTNVGRGPRYFALVHEGAVTVREIHT